MIFAAIRRNVVKFYTTKTNKIHEEILAYQERQTLELQSSRVRMSKSRFHQFLILASFLLSVVEIILVGLKSTKEIYLAQKIILIVSTSFYMLDILILSKYITKIIDQVKHPFYSQIDSIIECFDGPTIYDGICLLFGWIFIFYRPGLSVFRCFRILRFFWHFENIKEKIPEGVDLRKYYFSISHVSKLCVKYLENLGYEVFTAASQGGTVLLFNFFLTAYIFAVVLWIEIPDLETPEGPSCSQLNTCFVTLLRLTFYDGNGLDLLQYAMVSDRNGITFILFIYLILTAIILLNGLIGIFGNVFQLNDDSSATFNNNNDNNNDNQISSNLKNVELENFSSTTTNNISNNEKTNDSSISHINYDIINKKLDDLLSLRNEITLLRSEILELKQLHSKSFTE